MIKQGKHFAHYFTAQLGIGKGWLEMPSKKQIKNLFKKATIIMVASAVVGCMMALPLGTFVPKPAKAAVTVSSIEGAPPGMMIGPGMLFPALGINVAGDSGETLVSVKVNILIPGGSDFDPTIDLSPLSATDDRAGVTLYKDNKSAGDFGYPDPPEDFYDTHLPLASTPTWSQNGSVYEVTLTLASADAVPADDTGNNTGGDYFVLISTSNNPPPGAYFQVQIPANGVTLDTTTFPSTASPASPNVIAIGQGGMMGSPVVISEIQTVGGGANATSDEFIELYNRTPDPVDLSSWSIQYKDGTADNLSVSSPASKVALSGTIPANGFFLIANADGYDGAKAADVAYADTDFALAASGGTVFLTNSQTALTSSTDSAIQDKVGWGDGTISPYAEGTAAPAPAANGSIERKAFPESTTTSMTAGIDVGMGNGFDSDSNVSDFILRTTADPQNTSDTESPEMSGTNPVVINEVYYNNTSSDHQWIELYNNAGAPEDISGWKVLAAGKTYTIPASTNIEADGYLVVHWNTAGTNNSTNLYTGTASWAAMSTLAGDVYFTDGGDGAKDYVEYGAGGQTNEATAGGSQWPAGDHVPGVLQGESIGRGNNGYDTNKASDWQTFAVPTIGAMNTGGDSFSPDPVTIVVLADSDNTSFGLDGEDVTVTWTPATTPDTTFDKYVIYLLPAADSLDTVMHIPFAEVYGGQSVASFSASPSRTKDSAGNNLADGSYRAFVMAMDWAMNKSVAIASAPATLTGETSAESGADNDPPMIMSMPAWSFQAGANVTVLANIHDNRDLDSSTPTQLKWRVSGGGGFSAVTGTELITDSGLFRYVFPWNGGWNTSTRLDYYLVALDAAGNYSYFTTNPAFDTAPSSHDAGAETTAATFFFSAGFNAASNYNRTISGTVFDSAGVPLSGTGVFIPGSGLDVFTTGSGGTYSFTVTDGNYPIVAVKSGYMEGWIDGISVNTGNTASTGNDFYLSDGHFGQGGDGERAFVMWTDPFDGMMGVPIDIGLNAAPIVAHMSETMDSSTIIDTNATDAGSNVFLTTTGEDRVTGQVTYDETDPSDPKIIFYSSTPLSKGTTYFFVITPKVTDLAGNPIEGNQPDGRFVMEFSTFSDASGGTFGQGIAFPPYVTGTMPAPGSFNVPTNTKISVTFSESMDSSTVETSTGTGLNLRLFDPDAGQYVTLSSVSLDDATNSVATITVAGGLAANHPYDIHVLGGAKSMKGIYMADPSQSGYETLVVYMSPFDTGAGADASGAPQIVGINLEMYRNSSTGNISVAGTLTDVPVNLGVIEIGFNKDIDPATVSRTTISLKVGTTLVKGTVNYKSLDRVATFSPSLALNPNTTYTLKVLGGSSGIADIVGGTGHYLASDYYAVFTASSQADIQTPFISFAKASDFKMAISFSEPMNTAKKTNTGQWPSSVLNPANYTLYTDTGPPEQDPNGSPYTGNGCTTGNLSEAQGLTFKYDGEAYTIIIEGLQLPPRGGFRIWVNNVTDLSGNIIEGNIAAPDISAFGRNAAGGPIKNSADGGMMGPGGGGMTGPGGGGMDMGNMGMNPTGVFPMSMIAGATTTYMVDMPLSRAISANGTVVLTFPSGFDISGAKNADPNGEWVHKDINGPGPGVVVLGNAAESPQSGGLNNDGVVVNTSAKTVTITLGAVGTAGYQTGGDTSDDHDFIHLEIAGIKNSNIPKSFETSGYTVDIKTIAGGSLLESISSMPFFITEAGQYTISGTITFPNNITTATGEPIYIFGGSPMVGPIDIDVSFTNSATANYSITGLPAGEYHIGTEPVVTITGGVGDGDYFGSGMPEPIWVDDTTTTNKVYTKNFTFTAPSSELGLTVNIVGDFSGDKVGDIDIFAGSPTGFSVKTVTLNTNYTAESPFSTTLYLPANGSYMVGMGPAMPKGPMTMGPPPMPEWTPPPPVDVSYDGTNWTESSGTANDGIVLFTVGTALEVRGHVLDGAGNPIPNVEVYAYSPMGMFGTHASSLPDGSFTLYLAEGMYKAGAFLPGMPPSGEIGVDVRLVSGQTKVYVDGVETTDVIIKIAKPERTISGKVTDGTNTIAGASVYAYRTDGPGHAETMTDSSGVYILYATPGTWNVGAFLPGYGPLPEKMGIEVTTSDKENVNFFPEAGVTYVKISGTVSIGGVLQTYIPIRAVEVAADGSFTGYDNGASTDSNGNYSIKVKGAADGKHYRVDIGSPEYGEVEANSGSGVTQTPTPAQPWNVAVTTSDVANVNITVDAADLKTLTISFTGGSSTMTAYVDIMRIDSATGQPLDMGKHFEINDLTGTTTVNLPAGTYHGFAHIPGYGEFIPTEGQNPPYYLDLTSNATATFELSGIGEATVSGTVQDGQGNPIPDAFVHIGNPETGMNFGTPADSSGNYTLAIRAGTYMMGAEKPGYISEQTTITVSAGANTQDLTITKTSLTISGYVYVDADNSSSYNSGEGVSFGFVHAEKLGGGFAGTPVDPDGSYTLYVSPGDWRLFGAAEGYQEKAYAGNPVTVESTSVNGTNILVSDNVSLSPPKAQPFKPASGATFDDPNASLKITVPPMAAGSETSDFQVQAKETSNLPSSPTAVPLGGKGDKITFFDASGNPVTTLDDDITIEMSYTKAELTAAGLSSLAEVAKVKMAYWDDSASAYVTLPTTIGYTPATGANWTSLISVIFKATTSHLTVFSPIVTSDALAPATPSSLVATAGNGQVSLTWTAPTTSADGSALTDLLGYEIYRSTSATGTYAQVNATNVQTTSYTDTTVTNGTTYYYKVTTADSGGNESSKSSVSSGVTPSAPSVGGGGTGGGGGGAPSTTMVDTSGLSSEKSLRVNTSGIAQQSSQLKTSDGRASLDIAAGTKLLDSQGSALDSLSASKVTSPSAPPSESAIVSAYNFDPDGATFEPAITLTTSYDLEALLEQVTEDELYIAYWDGSQWQGLESTVDAKADTVSAKISHFTQFAVIGKLPPTTAEPTLVSFTISALSVTPNEVRSAEKVIVSALVTKTGDGRDKYIVALKINGVEEDRKEVTLFDVGVSQKVRFSIAKNIAGTYDVDINGLVGVFVVEEAAVAPPSPPSEEPLPVPSEEPLPVPSEEPLPVPSEEPLPIQPVNPLQWWLLGGSIIAAVAVGGIVIWQLITRRRAS
ncbi:carboxypeptidase regulatory-like domain-containing protein [Chloroflexota bacterium]